jgi:hypothetical protein
VYGEFRQCESDSLTGDCNVFEHMCKRGSGSKDEWKARQQATSDGLGRARGKIKIGNDPELPNTTFMRAIRQVPNSNKDQTSCIQLQALYTDVRHWE